jgi:nitrate/nitrite transporter NarK
MIKFFDYLFYRVSNIYITKYKDAQGMIFGIGVVSIVQLIHILLVMLVLAFFSENINEIIFKRREGLNFMHSGIIYPCLLILTINLFRYLKLFPYEKAKKYWEYEETKIKYRRGWWITLYIIVNFGLTLALSIYRKYYFN